MNTTTGTFPLTRSRHDRMLGGVAAGVAAYARVDVLVVRLAFAVLTILGPGIPLYLAGWLLIPDERSGESVAETVAADLRGGVR